MDPDTIRSCRSRIRMDLLPYCEGGCMMPVDLSVNCEGWIYDPNGSGIQIVGVRSWDPFSGSKDMSGRHRWCRASLVPTPRSEAPGARARSRGPNRFASASKPW